MEELQQDRAVAWGVFERVYSPFVKANLKRFGISQSDLDDVAQGVLITVAKSVKAFELQQRIGSFRVWLQTISRSRAVDHLRVHKRRDVERSLDAVDEGSILNRDSDSEAREQQELSELYARATAELSNYFRKDSVEIFLALVKGGSVAAIAAERGKSEAAIRQTKVRVLRRLREIAGE